MNLDCKTGGKGSRKFFILALAFVLCGAMVVTLFAADSTEDVEAYDPFEVEVDGITYVVTRGPSAPFTQYWGYYKSDTLTDPVRYIEEIVHAIHPETSEEMEIRLEYIADEAFKGNTTITDVSIPSGFDKIGASAFEGCTNLVSVTCHSGTQGVKEIGANAFKGCTSLTASLLTAFSPSLETIGANAFEGCTSLGQSNANLTYLRTVGDAAFKGSGLVSMTFPTGSITLGVGIFEDCKDLTSFTLGTGTQGLAKNMFKNSGLTSITFPYNQAGIAESAFEGCAELETVTFHHESLVSDYFDVIGVNAFKDCTALKSVSFPQRIDKVSDGAFENCISLEEAIFGRKTSRGIESDINEIGANAFKNCTSLEIVSFAEYGGILVKVGAGAFEGCASLSNMHFGINGGMGEIGANAFKDCTALRTINLRGVSTIGDNAFKGAGLTSIGIFSYTTTFGTGIFENCVELETVAFEASFYSSKRTSITGVNMFDGCVALVRVGMPSTVTTINSSVFNNTPSLGIIAIPVGATIVGDGMVDKVILRYSGNAIGMTAWMSGGDVHMAIDMVDDDVADIVTAGLTAENMNIPVSGNGNTRNMNIGAGTVVYVNVTGDDSLIIIGDGSSDTASASKTELVAAKEAMDEDPSILGVKFWTSNGSVTFDVETLEYVIEELGTGNTLTVKIEKMDTNGLPFSIRDVTLDRQVYYITITGMSTFEVGKLKISLRYDLLEGEKPGKLSVNYLPATLYTAGPATELPHTYSDTTTMYSSRSILGNVISYPGTYGDARLHFEATEMYCYFVGYDDTPELEKYKVTIVNGDEAVEVILEDGTEIVLPQPMKTATAEFTYIFESWTNWTAGMKVSGDIIITAVFTPVKNVYTVTFVNGDETTDEILEYGTLIVLPEPMKTATAEFTYIFESWTNWTAGMTVTGDVMLKANFVSVLTIDNDDIGDMTDDDGNIVIGDDDSESVGVSADTLDAVKDEMDGNSDMKGLEIKTQNGSVTLDADVIGYIKDKLDERNEAVLAVNMVRMDNALLSDVVQSVVGDRPVYNITMNTMSTFGGGKLKISLKYDLLENEDPEKILIWHISETGSVTAHPCTYSNGYVHFETTHLSYYFVGYDDSTEPLDDGFPIEYIIGIAAVAIIAIIAVVFLRKN